MSVLVHLCRGCGHQGTWHEGGNGGYTSCRCCRGGTADLDPTPTVLPTWTAPDGIPEPLWEPGAVRNGGTTHASRTCACATCREAAERITRREHPSGAGRMEASFGR